MMNVRTKHKQCPPPPGPPRPSPTQYLTNTIHDFLYTYNNPPYWYDYNNSNSFQTDCIYPFLRVPHDSPLSTLLTGVFDSLTIHPFFVVVSSQRSHSTLSRKRKSINQVYSRSFRVIKTVAEANSIPILEYP